jgi:hypothetical protein
MVECEMLGNLSAVAGSLPLLETLCIEAQNENIETLINVAKFFSHAPRLRRLDFCGPLSAVAQLPLEQLSCCTFSGLGPDDLPSLLSSMDRYQLQDTELHVELNFETLIAALPLDLPSVVSHIEELDICSMEHTGYQSHRVLAEIFSALTLPAMKRLHLYAVQGSGQPLYWPHMEGLALLLRSGSPTRLKSLSLHDVMITERDLLQCLADLPLLQYLFISDHPGLEDLPGKPANHVVTDSLLKRITPGPGSPAECFIPNLEIVDFKTLGTFTDDVLLEFVVQRSLLASVDEPFECALLWVPGHARQLKDQVIGVLKSGMQQGRLVFTSREYDPNEED